MDIQKIYQSNKKIIGLVGIAIVVLLTIYFIQRYSSKAQEMLENVVASVENSVNDKTMPLVDSGPSVQEPQVSPLYSDGADDCTLLPTMDFNSGAAISPEDLLPKSDLAADFENQFPIGTGDLTSKNFLTAGFNTGINTVSSSLRNANLQLRSDPYIPPKEVTPFNQTTMTPDLNRKSFEIGT